MAQVDITPSFGAELKDGYKPVNSWVSSGISWLDDIQSFYRERAVIEKEYGAKLSALAKKYFEKKAKKVASLSVGDTPVTTPGSLESASMSTWTTQLNTLESRAAEHDKFSAQLVTNIAEPLRILSGRYEELRKLHADYATRLEKEKDSAYGDLRKMKGKYDSVCQEVENRRKKIDGSLDVGKQKAQITFQQHVSEMHNVKNTYIISINVTNKQKELYYNEYVPELLDSLQDLNETRVGKLNSLWALAAQIETQTMSRNTEYLNHLSAEIPRNKPSLDSMMFARHNTANWQEPGHVSFEPSPVWHDEGVLATDEQAKNFLRNVLTKSKGALTQLKRDVDTKKREVLGARRVRQAVREGRDKRDEVELVRQIFDLQTAVHESERQRVTAEVEISTITSAVGDVSVGARNHNFKSETFKIPTNCDHCGERIWGLSAKGFSCRDCGFTCHNKCEMKIPADCPGEQSKEEKKKLKLERQEAAHAANTVNGSGTLDSPSDMPRLARSDTMNTLSSGYSANARRSVSNVSLPPSTAPTDEAPEEPEPEPQPKPKPVIGGRRRIAAPPPMQYVTDAGADEAPSDLHESSQRKGRMLYPYQQNGEGEISVEDGKEVVIVDPDDGSGWMKVRSGRDEGLVPASYVEALPMSLTTPVRPASTYSASSISVTGSVNAPSTAGSSVGGAAVKKKGPAVAPKRGAKKLKYVEALYEYEARTEAEHSMHEGERFVLVNKDSGDGWADVEKGGVVKSVPANYIQEV